MTIKLPREITDYLDLADDAAQERLLTYDLSFAHEGFPMSHRGCIGQIVQNSKTLLWNEVVPTPPWRVYDKLMLGDGAYMAQTPKGVNDHRLEVQQAIRDYVVELRLKRGGTVPEPQMREAVPA